MLRYITYHGLKDNCGHFLLHGAHIWGEKSLLVRLNQQSNVSVFYSWNLEYQQPQRRITESKQRTSGWIDLNRHAVKQDGKAKDALIDRFGQTILLLSELGVVMLVSSPFDAWSNAKLHGQISQ